MTCTTVDLSNNLYVTSFSPASVTKWNADTGSSISFTLSPSLTTLIGVAADSNNNLYLVSNSSGIYKYNATTGAQISGPVLPSAGSPYASCVDSNNNLYVTYISIVTANSGYINKYSAGGTVTTSFITNLWNPQGIYVDKQNNLYVSNLGNYKIGKYNANTGATINVSFISLATEPDSITGDNNNNLYVFSANTVQQYNMTTGTLITPTKKKNETNFLLKIKNLLFSFLIV